MKPGEIRREPDATNKFVLTGGPGLGKSTLLNRLSAFGFNVVPEAATLVIDHWRSHGQIWPSPWEDRLRFELSMKTIMIEQYDVASPAKPVMFDRGLPDILAWRKAFHFPVDETLMAEVRARPYERIVFLTPNWAPWYAPDANRPFDYEAALSINDAIRTAYADLHYRIVELPESSVELRAAFVANRVIQYKEDGSQ